MIPVELDDDMVQMVETQRLCYAATVGQGGIPNLSPKGTVRVWDKNHICFCDIASPGTIKNIQANSWVELNVVDILSRRGYRFLGKGSVHRNDDVFMNVTNRIFKEEEVTYSVQCVVLVKVLRALPIVSPGYEHVQDEFEMRELWKKRRKVFDGEFEKHIDQIGQFRAERQTK